MRAGAPGQAETLRKNARSAVRSRIAASGYRRERYRDSAARSTSPSSNARRSKRRSPSAATSASAPARSFGWIYRRGVTDLAAMTDLPRELRATLAAEFTLTTPAARRARALDRRHREVPAAPGRRPADRVGVHPRHAGDDLLHLHAGRLRDGLRVLPDRQDGAGPQSDRGRNRRPGPRAGRCARPARQAPSTSS